MGNRGNIILDYGKDQTIGFYTHWDGGYLKEVIQDALKKGVDRWNDPSYLARIIFSELIKEDVDGTTGYGIYPGIWSMDNENPIVYVKFETYQVIVEDSVFSFKEFVDLKLGE